MKAVAEAKVNLTTVITTHHHWLVSSLQRVVLRCRVAGPLCNLYRNASPKRCCYSQTSRAQSSLNSFYIWCNILLTGLQHSPVVGIPLKLFCTPPYSRKYKLILTLLFLKGELLDSLEWYSRLHFYTHSLPLLFIFSVMMIRFAYQTFFILDLYFFMYIATQ